MTEILVVPSVATEWWMHKKQQRMWWIHQHSKLLWYYQIGRLSQKKLSRVWCDGFGSQTFKSLHKSKSNFVTSLLWVQYLFQYQMRAMHNTAQISCSGLFEKENWIDQTKALPHALFVAFWSESISEKTHQVRWAEGWHCQNSTVSGSGSAEQLLWCPGSKESWVQFFSALVEHCMLGRLQNGAGFCRFNEGSRPVGKKKW